MNRKAKKDFDNCLGACIRCNDDLLCNPANPLYKNQPPKKPNIFSTHSGFYIKFLKRLKKKLGFLGKFRRTKLHNIRVHIYLKGQYFKRRLKKIYIKLRGKDYARQLECNPNKFE